MLLPLLLLTMPTRLTARPKPFYPSPAERIFDKISDCIQLYCISPNYQNLPFYRDPGTRNGRSIFEWSAEFNMFLLYTGSCFMIIPLSNDLLLNICFWLLFDLNELFIVPPPTGTTAQSAPTLKSIVPLEPERLSPVAHLANSHFKS